MRPLEYSDSLPSGIGRAVTAGDCRLYLRPVGLDTGPSRGSHQLLGGFLAFKECEVLLRTRERIVASCAPVTVIRDWAATEGEASCDRIADLLRNLESPRLPFAGLTLDRPRIMGVLNVTPDSFSDGGEFREPEAAIAHGHALVASGADLVDIGGESTRPGAEPVSVAEEIARIEPVVRALACSGVPVSIDTRRAGVMAAALAAGATVINDVTALEGDPDSVATVAGAGAPVVLMHMQGEPATMNRNPRYDHAPLDVYDYLESRVEACRTGGIKPERIAVDPGLGFGKSSAHNVEIMRNLALYHGLGCALLIGASRKGLIRTVRRSAAPGDRLAGSIAAALAGLELGVQIVRVHDVAETGQAFAVWRALRKTNGEYDAGETG